jgi:ComF family protein
MIAFKESKTFQNSKQVFASLPLIEFWDFFFPRLCISCNEKLNKNERIICLSCFNKIKSPTKKILQQEFEKKFLKTKIISDFYSAFLFEKDGVLQDAIHALKYNSRFLTGVFWGKVLGNFMQDKIIDWDIDFIIPVPLHKFKRLERGYNQSYYISKGLSKRLDLKLNNRILERIRYTKSQTKLNMSERQENMKGAFFVINKKQIIGKNILLVDDVITTGATVSECGKVLLEAGAAKVYSASIAIAE